MRTTLIAAIALCAGTAPVSASATTYFNYIPNVGGDFGNTNPKVYPPHFVDNFKFKTDYDRKATIDIWSAEINPKTGNIDPKYNINFISNGVKLFYTVGGKVKSVLIPATSTGVFEERFLSSFFLPKGASNVIVAFGSAGPKGSYDGILTLSGVPEMSTWAMMIIGFGFTGGALRRRTRRTKTIFAAA